MSVTINSELKPNVIMTVQHLSVKKTVRYQITACTCGGHLNLRIDAAQESHSFTSIDKHLPLETGQQIGKIVMTTELTLGEKETCVPFIVLQGNFMKMLEYNIENLAPD